MNKIAEIQVTFAIFYQLPFINNDFAPCSFSEDMKVALIFHVPVKSANNQEIIAKWCKGMRMSTLIFI
ncbi:hypothetical protein M8286_10235 [Streptococcus suis]|uniref:hypothetical protein n=1 Tax=Streptococcus suis TaxID=1307 RepID=UPI0030E38FFC